MPTPIPSQPAASPLSSSLSSSLSPSEPPEHSNGVLRSFAYGFSSWQRFRTEVLAGITVALSLFPEALAFSLIAHVVAGVGLWSSVILTAIIALTGGRPAMLTAAAGAVALAIAPMSPRFSSDEIVAAVLLSGLLQVILAALGIAKLLRFIPRSVLIGFVNSLGVLVFLSQLPYLAGASLNVYLLVAAGVVLMLLSERFISAIPAPLVVIAILWTVVIAGHLEIPRVSVLGEIPSGLPSIGLPDIDWSYSTLVALLPFSFTIALVGLMESLLTAKIIDDITDQHSDKTREAWGLGIASAATTLFGGMGGCAMLGQSMINVKVSGARTRLSTLTTSLTLLVILLVGGSFVPSMPLAALIAIMVVVAVKTVDWYSVSPRTLRFMPISETAVMASTMLATLLTHNLAIGVGCGVTIAMMLFARRVAHVVNVNAEPAPERETTTFTVNGQLFWASSNDLVYQFDYNNAEPNVVIDLKNADIWDASSVASLDAVIRKFETGGHTVDLVGVDPRSQQFLDRLSGRLKTSH